MTLTQLAIIDRLPRRLIAADHGSGVMAGDLADALMKWIKDLNPKTQGSVSSEGLFDRFEARDVLTFDFAPHATLRAVLAKGLEGASNVSVALAPDGVLALAVRFDPAKAEAFPARLDRMVNVGRIVGKLVRHSLGMRSDDALDPAAVEKGRDGFLVPRAHLSPVCVEIGANVPEADAANWILGQLHEPHTIWRLNRTGWTASSATLDRALDDRLDHLLRRHDRVLKQIRDKTADKHLGAEWRRFSVLLLVWKASVFAFTLIVIGAMGSSGILRSVWPSLDWAFTSESLTVFGASALLLGLVLWFETPRPGMSAGTAWRNAARLTLCWLAVGGTALVAFLMLTNPPPFSFAGVKPDGTTAYFFEAILGAVWLSPLLAVALIWREWTVLRDVRDEIRLSTKPQTTLLDGLEKAIRRNDPSLDEVLVAGRIANQIAPVRAQVEARQAAELRQKAARDRVYALIAASVTFLGPLNAMKPEFKTPPPGTAPLFSVSDVRLAPAVWVDVKPPPAPPQRMAGPLISIGDIRLAPAVRMNLAPVVTPSPAQSVTVAGPLFSFGNIRTAPLVSLSLETAAPVMAGLSRQVENLAAAVRGGPLSTLALLVLATPREASSWSPALSFAGLPGISAHCEGSPVASLHFPTNASAVDAATLRARDGLTVTGATTTQRLAGLLADPAVVPEDSGILLVGHADPSGDAAHNLTLSQRRAEAVRRAIAGVGGIRTLAPAQGMGSLEWMTGGPVAGLGQTMDAARRVDVFLCRADAILAAR